MSKRKVPQLSKETKENIVDAVEAGASQKAVAERFGVAQSTVSRLMRLARDRRRAVVSDELGDLVFDEPTNSYIGTVILPDGTKAGERFPNSKHAHERDVVAKYKAWRNTRLDEHQFLAMVERRDPATPSPDRREEELAPVDVTPVDVTLVPVPETDVRRRPDRVYVVMCKGTRPYGAYVSMDAALEDADRLNEALTFAGMEPAYEAFECDWRG